MSKMPQIAHSPAPILAANRKITRTADSKGRITLGNGFANQTVVIEQVSQTEVSVKLARVIPESETWLYSDAGSLQAVREGLADARSGRFVAGPTLNTDDKLASVIED